MASGIPPAKQVLPNDLRVGDCMREEGGWDKRTLEEFYAPIMVEEICKVKIGGHEGDEGFWKFEEDGKFSVKSGYKAASKMYEPPSCQEAYDQKFWKRMVWDLKLPPKVKVFYWKTMNNFLPVAANLAHHHLPTKGLCEFCGKYWGTTVHCIFYCEKIKHVWKGSNYWDIMKKMKSSEMWEIGVAMRESYQKNYYEIWVMMMWLNWKFLCQKKHDPDGVLIEIGMDFAREQLENFHKSGRVTRQRSFFGVSIGERVWKPPKEGIFRVDVDACFDTTKSLFGIGIVIRDNKGEVRAAMAKPITDPGSILEAELIALVYGLELALQETLEPMVIFSDSILAVHSVSTMSNRGAETLECFGEFEYLRHQGVILEICHMYREANRVAHSLARFGALQSCISCWSSQLPHWLRDVVKLDLI